jgi:hypothetical protein
MKRGIRDRNPKRQRADGGGRKLTSGSLEDQLVLEIDDLRLRGKKVSHKTFLKMNSELKIEHDVEELQMSNGWIYSFLHRNNYSLRKVLSTTTLSNDEIGRRGATFLHRFRYLHDHFGLMNENIWNMDETAIFVEDDDLTTIDRIGTRLVSISTAGFTKIRITGICLASASDKKTTNNNFERIDTRNFIVGKFC